MSKAAEIPAAAGQPFDDAEFEDMVRRIALTIGGLPEFCPLRDCRRVRRCIGDAEIDERPPCWEDTLLRTPVLRELVLTGLLRAAARGAPGRSGAFRRR